MIALHEFAYRKENLAFLRFIQLRFPNPLPAETYQQSFILLFVIRSIVFCADTPSRLTVFQIEEPSISGIM